MADLKTVLETISFPTDYCRQQIGMVKTHFTISGFQVHGPLMEVRHRIYKKQQLAESNGHITGPGG